MKIFIILMVLVVAVSSNDIKKNSNDIKPSQHLKDLNENIIINKLFEALRAFIKYGSATQGIPVLDPFIFANRSLEIFKENLLSLNMDFTNGIVEGLGDFEVLKSKFVNDELALDICVNFPSLSFKSDYYNMSGAIFEAILLRGKGAIEISVTNVKLWSIIKIKQVNNGNSIIIDNIMNPGYNIQQVFTNIEYDGNIDAIANAILSGVVPDYLNRFSNYIAYMTKDTVMDLLNQYMKRLER